MRLILRILGTWLVGIGMVLLVIDGIKSLAASFLVTTGLGALWGDISPQSLDIVHGFLQSRFFAPVLEQGFGWLLAAPAFAVFAIPGLVFALAGRTPSRQLIQYTEV